MGDPNRHGLCKLCTTVSNSLMYIHAYFAGYSNYYPPFSKKLFKPPISCIYINYAKNLAYLVESEHQCCQAQSESKADTEYCECYPLAAGPWSQSLADSPHSKTSRGALYCQDWSSESQEQSSLASHSWMTDLCRAAYTQFISFSTIIYLELWYCNFGQSLSTFAHFNLDSCTLDLESLARKQMIGLAGWCWYTNAALIFIY